MLQQWFRAGPRTAAKERKTAKELDCLALDIVRRMKGCGHVEAVTVTSDLIRTSKPGHADNSDVRRAILVDEADLDRFDLAWGDDKTG
jgi:hypothetical protein